MSDVFIAVTKIQMEGGEAWEPFLDKKLIGAYKRRDLPVYALASGEAPRKCAPDRTARDLAFLLTVLRTQQAITESTECIFLMIHASELSRRCLGERSAPGDEFLGWVGTSKDTHASTDVAELLRGLQREAGLGTGESRLFLWSFHHGAQGKKIYRSLQDQFRTEDMRDYLLSRRLPESIRMFLEEAYPIDVLSQVALTEGMAATLKEKRLFRNLPKKLSGLCNTVLGLLPDDHQQKAVLEELLSVHSMKTDSSHPVTPYLWKFRYCIYSYSDQGSEELAGWHLKSRGETWSVAGIGEIESFHRWFGEVRIQFKDLAVSNG